MKDQTAIDNLNGMTKGTPAQQMALARLRELVFEVGNELSEVNQISESVKWGQASFEATSPKTGSPVRMDILKNTETGYALFFICTTTLVQQFREQYGDQLKFDKNRAIVFDTEKTFPNEAVKHCIAMALTYRLKQ